MIDEATVARLARHWEEGWNGADVDVILAPFAAAVRYMLDATLAGTDTIVLVDGCHLPDGATKPGADLMRLDGDGEVVEWRCHYTTDPTARRP